MNPPPSSGTYVDLIPTDRGNLRIALTADGKDEVETFRIEKYQHGTWAALVCLLDDHLSCGWELIAPEELAALTSAPILGTGIDRDDQGKICRVEHLYWFPDYAIRDEIEELLTAGEITFDRAPSETPSDTPHIIG